MKTLILIFSLLVPVSGWAECDGLVYASNPPQQRCKDENGEWKFYPMGYVAVATTYGRCCENDKDTDCGKCDGKSKRDELIEKCDGVLEIMSWYDYKNIDLLVKYAQIATAYCIRASLEKE